MQSYAKHTTASIFRVRDLDWVAYAEGWGLLRLPRMPELRKVGFTGDPSLGLNVDWKEYAYQDAAKEAKRRREMDAEGQKRFDWSEILSRIPAGHLGATSDIAARFMPIELSPGLDV